MPQPATATNPAATVPPGATATYEWAIAPDEPEGTHYFHSHGDERVQTDHGLFGALIVEPAGSAFLDPVNGQAIRSGWSAMIQAPNGSDFREFAIIYHEVGAESYRHLDKQDLPVTLLDRITTSYKPGGFAINYRSEPFRNRLQLQDQLTGRIDISQPYSSYAFGDPATPTARAYLGDPVKRRVRCTAAPRSFTSTTYTAARFAGDASPAPSPRGLLWAWSSIRRSCPK